MMLSKLESEFDALYMKALDLQENPEDPEYKKIKEELWSIYKQIDRIIR